MQHDPNAFLMGAKTRSAAFPNQQFGATVTGTITEPPELRQRRDFDTDKPLFYDDGNPMMQLVVKLATAERDPLDAEDDGVRAVYVRDQMRNAVGQAVRAAGADRLAVGGALTVTYVRDEPNSRGKGNPKKIYTASYVPPAPGAEQAAYLATPPAGEGGGQPWASAHAPAAPVPQQQYAPAGNYGPGQPGVPAAAPVQQYASTPGPELPVGGGVPMLPPPPPGIDPAAWQRMPAEQRDRTAAAIQAAMGSVPPF